MTYGQFAWYGPLLIACSDDLERLKMIEVELRLWLMKVRMTK